MALPLGLLSALGVVAALGGRRTAPLGLLAAAGIVDDVSGGPHLFRRLLPHRPTFNVTGTRRRPGRRRDARLRRPPRRRQRRPDLPARADPARGRHVPGVVRSGRARRRRCCGWSRPARRSPASARCSAARLLRRLGTFVAAGSTLAFFDIGTRTVVPGANDNLTAVAVLLELARRLRGGAGRAACACCSSPPARRSRSWRACAAGCAATAPGSTPRAPASWCSRRSARRS